MEDVERLRKKRKAEIAGISPRRPDDGEPHDALRTAKKSTGHAKIKKHKRKHKDRKRQRRHDKWLAKVSTAVRNNDCEKLEKLIKKRNKKHVQEYISEFDKDGQAPIHVAASYGYWRVCQILLYHGADINSRDASHSTPLHYACLNEQHQTVSFLIKHSAETDIVNDVGARPADLGLERLLRRSREEDTLRRLEREFEEEMRLEQEQEERERRDWAEKMAYEFAGEDDQFWLDSWRSREEEAREEDMTNEQWKDHIAAQRRRKAAQTFPSATAAGDPKRQQEREERRRLNERVGAKIAEEERRREEVRVQRRVELQQQRSEDFDARWREFEAYVRDDSFGPQIRIRLKDIPFPDIEQDERNGTTLAGFDVMAGNMTMEEKKKGLRELFLRWHPDKFQHRYGHLFNEADSGGIMDMVTRITQHIADLKAKLNKLE